MKTAFTIALSAFLLAGCATPRPQLPDQNYTSFAKFFVGINKCVQNGYMSPETGALANRYVKADLNTWTFNEVVLRERVMQISDQLNPTEGDCRLVAMKTAEEKNQIDANNAQVQKESEAWQSIQPQQPVNTTCNKVGTQTFCNTY